MPDHPTWEYKTLRVKPGLLGSFDTERFDEILRAEGRAGWELVSAVQTGPVQPVLLFLKRAR